jgi:hypothetical protein
LCNQSREERTRVLAEIPIIVENCVQETDREVFAKNLIAYIKLHYANHCFPNERTYEQSLSGECRSCIETANNICDESENEEKPIFKLLNGEDCWMNFGKKINCLKKATDENDCNQCFDLIHYSVKIIKDASLCD